MKSSSILPKSQNPNIVIIILFHLWWFTGLNISNFVFFCWLMICSVQSCSSIQHLNNLLSELNYMCCCFKSASLGSNLCQKHYLSDASVCWSIGVTFIQYRWSLHMSNHHVQCWYWYVNCRVSLAFTVLLSMFEEFYETLAYLHN